MTDPGHPDQRLTDALERVGHVLRVRMRSAAGEHGLSPIQAQLLLRLVTSEAAEREPAQLASWLDVRPPTVSDALAALRRKGLVERRPAGGDARRFRLDPTPRGRRVATQLAEWDGPVRAQLGDLPGPAKDTATGLLLELIGRLQQAGLVGVARTCTTCRFFRPEVHPDAAAPHHCALLDAPLGPATLRLDCPDHLPAS